MFELKVLGAADETERLPCLFAGLIEVHLVLHLLMHLCHTQLDDTAYLDIPLEHDCGIAPCQKQPVLIILGPPGQEQRRASPRAAGVIGHARNCRIVLQLAHQHVLRGSVVGVRHILVYTAVFEVQLLRRPGDMRHR